ncbi:MAG: polymer-forming cytoskeletal protein [Candidatus Neomarinimicrobiota bacterium]
MTQDLGELIQSGNQKQPEAGTLNVGKGVVISGEIKNCNVLKLDGTIEGNIDSIENLMVQADGKFIGSATVGNAQISGMVTGDITVNQRLTIAPTGVVDGKIRYNELEIGRGGTLIGKISRIVPSNKIAFKDNKKK